MMARRGTLLAIATLAMALLAPSTAFSTPTRVATRVSPLASVRGRKAHMMRSEAPRPRLAPAAKGALVALAALVLSSHPLDADAAVRSGGRIGGRSPSMSRSRMSSSPRMRAPSSSVNIHVSPPAIISPYGGYGGYYRPAPSIGFGFGYPGYGYGYSPYYSPLGLAGDAIGIAAALARELERQAFISQQLQQAREIGRDQAQIRELQAALDAQNAKIEQLKAEAPPPPTGTSQPQAQLPPAATMQQP